MVTTRRGRTLRIDLQPHANQLADVRRGLRAWLTESGVSDPTADEMVLVANELCTNAIEATEGDHADHLDAAVDGGAVRFSVANAHRAGQPAVPAVAPGLESGSLQTRGRGLAIVEALVDLLTFESFDGRTIVKTVRLLES